MGKTHLPVLPRNLQTPVDVSLAYVRPGQSATTLSGGEAQRVELSWELSNSRTSRSSTACPSRSVTGENAPWRRGPHRRLRHQGASGAAGESAFERHDTAASRPLTPRGSWPSLRRQLRLRRQFVEAERNRVASMARYRGVCGGLIKPRMEAVFG